MAHPAAPPAVKPAVKNPHQAIWDQAERSLRFRIAAVHDTGWTVDRARDHLAWQGGSAQRFQERAQTRHRELHEHNDTLRYLLELVRRAGEASS